MLINVHSGHEAYLRLAYEASFNCGRYEQRAFPLEKEQTDFFSRKTAKWTFMLTNFVLKREMPTACWMKLEAPYASSVE